MQLEIYEMAGNTAPNEVDLGAKKGTIVHYVPSPYWPKSCYCWTKVVIEEKISTTVIEL